MFSDTVYLFLSKEGAQNVNESNIVFYLLS